MRSEGLKALAPFFYVCFIECFFVMIEIVINVKK